MTRKLQAIEVVDLVKRFPQRRRLRQLFSRGDEKVALDHVSLSIEQGEIFGLLGPNGAGKTTLVKILSTLVLPTEGTALVGGLDVVKYSRDVRRRIGVVYGDERTFFWRLSVLENLRFYAALYQIPGPEAERRIRRLLDLVGLAHVSDVQMHHFSTGMKQRAAIARGLLNDPEILFMDEPTRGLDPIAALDLRKLVMEHVADGRRTVLVATHIMDEAEDLCHRVAFISHGRIQLIGSIDQLRNLLRADEHYVIVVGDVDVPLVMSLQQVEGVRSVSIANEDNGVLKLELTVQRGSMAVPLVIRKLVEAGGRVWSCTPQELSLESMFAIAMNTDLRPGEAVRGDDIDHRNGVLAASRSGVGEETR